jgi:hypothetical protein
MKSLKIPKGGNQNPYIEEEQTKQWQKEKKYKTINNDLQSIHIFATVKNLIFCD